MCFSGRSLYTYERSLEKFGVRKKKFCRNSSARIFYSQYYWNVELRSVRLPLKVTESKIVVSSLFEILPMWFSLLNDRHRKRRIPLGASTKLPEREEFVSCGCRSTFHRNDCISFHDKETRNLVIFELKRATSSVGVRERNTRKRSRRQVSARDRWK